MLNVTVADLARAELAAIKSRRLEQPFDADLRELVHILAGLLNCQRERRT
jgi:hypothetical protein